MAWILLAILLVLFIVNVPIAWALSISSLIVLLWLGGIPLTVLPQRMFTGTDSFSLVAIPYFLLAGALMERAGISDRLIDLAQALVGHIKGGLGGISVASSMFFAGISGSAIADTAAVGRITIPAMLSRGYAPSYAVSIQATAGAIGIIIPPSIVMVIFAVVANASVGAMFLGGVIPGLLMGAALMLVGYVIARRRGYPTEGRIPVGELGIRFLKSIPALLMPVIIIGGILSGIVTPTESAVIAVVYAFLVGVLNRQLKMNVLGDVLYEVALSSAMIMLIVANASVFSWVITTQQLPQQVSALLGGITSNSTAVLLACAVVLLVAGMFLDTSAALIIFIPAMLPVVQMAGIDIVHFGVVAVVSLAIGLATPPVGLNLFVASDIAGIGIVEASRGLIWFLGAMLVIDLVLVFYPPLVLWLPEALG